MYKHSAYHAVQQFIKLHYVRIMKERDIIKVKNALIKPWYCVTE